jgi:hypothetical protein
MCGQKDQVIRSVVELLRIVLYGDLSNPAFGKHDYNTWWNGKQSIATARNLNEALKAVRTTGDCL